MSIEHPEALDDGGSGLLDLVAAVDYLRRGLRPGITVWDAIAEALQWTVPAGPDTSSSDPLRAALTEVLSTNKNDTMVTIQTAIRRWLETMADRYNDGYQWPHPAARRGFPPPRRDLTDD